jgi:large subunit ribosomal protein L29
MKASEIRELSADEVSAQIHDQEVELTNLRLRLATHQLEDGLAVRKTRRDVARLRTVLRAHELGVHPLGGSDSAGSEGRE